MSDTELAHRAIEIAENFDWWWSMDDGASYNASKVKAQASMKEFTNTVKQIKDAEMQELLRSYWLSCYNGTRPFQSSKDSALHAAHAEENLEKILNKISNTANITI